MDEVLKLLIDSACKSGSISDFDREIIYKKAAQQGISREEIDNYIEQQLSKNKSQDLESGFIPIDEVENEIKNEENTKKQDNKIKLTKTVSSSKFTNIEKLEYQGAMSTVYRAKQYGKWIIIKRIKPEYRNNAKYRELFFKEFENAYHLEHPNIVRLLDKGEDAEGPFYTMEYVDGRPLSKMITSSGINNERLAVKISKQILDALAYVHKKQVFHRDLKPDNIFITYRGDNVKILDFGLAAADYFDDNLKKAGTPRYAAPEQLTEASSVDQRADIYSFGKIFLEMLTGDVSQQAIQKVYNQAYRQIIAKATASNPADRYHDCEEIINDLKEAKNIPNKKNEKSTSQKIKQAKPSKSEGSSSKNRKWILISAFVIIVLILSYIIGRNVVKNNPIFHNKTEELLATADSLYNNAKFKQAKQIYEKIEPKTQQISDKIKRIDEIIKVFEQIQTQLDGKNLVRALSLIKDAQKKFPEVKILQTKADSCQNIIDKADFKNLQVVPESGTNKLGLADENGNVVVDYQFDYIAPIKQWHSKGLIPVKIGNKYGFVDRNKHYFAKCIYDPDPRNGKCVWQPNGFTVRLNGKSVYITVDSEGNGHIKQ